MMAQLIRFMTSLRLCLDKLNSLFLYGYRLELALLSAQKDSPWIGKVYDLLHLVWKTYHYSPKSRRELKNLGIELGVSVNNPG